MSDAIHTGLNADQELDDYVRCSRCGFWCKLSRDPRASEGSRAGWGLSYQAYDVCSTDYDDSTVGYVEGDSVVYDGALLYDQEKVSGINLNYDGNTNEINYDGIDKTIYDPVRSGGCPNCGTFLYNK